MQPVLACDLARACSGPTMRKCVRAAGLRAAYQPRLGISNGCPARRPAHRRDVVSRACELIDHLTPADHHHLGRHHQTQPLPRPVPGRHAYRATMPVRQDRGRGRSPCRCSQGAARPCSPARAAALPEGNALPQWPARPEGWGAGGKAPCRWPQGEQGASPGAVRRTRRKAECGSVFPRAQGAKRRRPRAGRSPCGSVFPRAPNSLRCARAPARKAPARAVAKGRCAAG